MADQVPRADELAMDGRVLLFVVGASVLTGIISGALPALRAGRTDLNEALKEGGRNESTVGLRTRRVLIVAEVALSLVLLMGAGVMVRTLSALRHVDAGFDPHNVLTMRLAVPQTRYATPARISAFFDESLQRIRALPGVESAGAVDDLPAGGGSVQPIVLEGQRGASAEGSADGCRAQDHAGISPCAADARCCAAATSPTPTRM